MTIESIKKNIEVYKPEITVTLGLIAMGAAIVKGIKSAPKAEVIKEDQALEPNYKRAISLAKVYAPTAGLYLLGSMFIMNSYNTLSRRAAALGIAYSMKDIAYNELSGKVKEVVGDKKVDEIRGAIAKDKVDSIPYSEENVICGEGSVIVLDVPSGRYFRSDKQTIESAENAVNKAMLGNGGSAVWNIFYRKLDWPEISAGDLVGFSMDYDGMNIRYSSILNSAGIPILVIDYDLMPLRDFADY